MSNLLEKASIVTTPTAYDNGKILSVKPAPGLGNEQITNGNFDTNSGWNLGSGITISGGSANFTGVANANINQSAGLITGKTYKIVFTVSNYVSGNIDYNVGGNTRQGEISANGTYTVYVVSDSGQIFYFQSDQTLGFTGSIDNVSVKQVIDGDFDFTRNSSATRVNSQGLIEDVQILSSNLVSNGDFSQEGSELITNGDFATDSDWTLGTGWSIVNGNANSDGVSSNSNLATTSAFFSGTVQVKMTISVTNYVSGTLKIYLSSLNFTDITENGEYTFYTTADRTDGKLYLKSINFIGSIDNVSVKEVGQGWTFGTGWSIEDGKVYFDNPTGTEFYQSLSTTASKYRISFDLDITSGTIQTSFSSPSTSTIKSFTTSGTKTVDITTTASFSRFRFVGIGGSVFNIDNISVVEITDDTNLPRIDYTGGVGSWLFEPQSTNLIPYSEDFTQWNKSNASLINTISSTVVSPDGVSYANKLYPIGSATSSFIIQGGSGNCFSVFVKKGERRWVLIYGGFANSNVWFDSENGVFGNIFDNVVTVESFGNDWYKIKILWAQNSSHVRIYNTDSGTSTQSTGNGTDGLYIWGAQLEVQSFATSYIPTNGSTVTRLQDAAFGSGSSDLINSIEGVLYAEIAALANDLTNKQISLNNGTTDDRIQLYYSTSSNQISVFYKSQSGATSFILNHTLSDITQFNKVAFKWKQNDFALWSNGVEVATQTSGVTSSADTLTKLDFLQFNGSADFFGKTKCVAVFKEALTDAELTCLTTI